MATASVIVKFRKRVLNSVRKKVITNLNKPAVRSQIGKLIEFRIKQRTLRSVDSHNRPFKAYTPAYAKFRTSKGRGTAVNLLFTGRMLGSMKSNNRAPNKVVVKIGERKKSVPNNKTRPFFGVNEQDVKAVKRILMTEYRNGS